MIIDGHTHVILPVERHLALMGKAGVDCSVLCITRIHPERAKDLAEFDREMGILNEIIAGKLNNVQATPLNAIEEHAQVIREHPTRFIGFGMVPVGLSYDETAAWLQKYVLAQHFRGLGEFTLAPGQVSLLEPIFALSSEFGRLPLWVHTFAPLTLADIRDLIALARRYSDVPVILGHLGGLNWRDTIQLAKETPQAYLDLSASFTMFAPVLAIRELPERTIFSSDAPHGDPLVARTIVEQATDSAQVRAQVLGDTLAELLKMA
jgi:predicted TIM-barrel fold metal-dependent hydrolase